jgi:alkanesulfonate monooxygenase SsuD/methylene tetrahydromethanopterin reductase-like flavin-dependent oxidoreductase (luciferase family)
MPGHPHSHRIRFGVGPLTAQVLDGPGDELATVLDVARTAEGSGLDEAWVSEHHLTGDGHIGSPLAVLAAIAATTRVIGLGTDIVIAPLYHPQRLFADAAQVAAMSDDRLLLGLGAGYRDLEFRAFGVARDERFARLEAAVHFLREEAGENGPRWPVLLGGLREPGVRRAGRLADGWIAPTLGHPDQLIRRLGWLDAERAFTRPFHVVVNMTVFAGDAPACGAARHGIVAVESRYLTWNGGQPSLAGAADGLPGHAIVGDPASCAEALQPWYQALEAMPANAIGHLNARLHFPGVGRADTLEAVRLFAAEVLPRVRAERAEPAS